MRNIQQANDLNYPLLAWNPDNKRLTVLTERRDAPQVVHIDRETGKKESDMLSPEYQRVYSMDYVNPISLAFSACVKGYSDLFLYNTANRKLIVFYGADGGFLGVSGMSITNYDVEKSSVKTLRDPAKFFKGLSSTGKRAMANAWKAIRAKESKPRARINEEMILLAAN